MSTFGQLLRSLREEAHKSLGMLARSLDVSVPYLSGVERGRRPPLTDDRILQVAQFLGLTPDREDQLRSAAAATRGFFELAGSSSDDHMRFGAALSRKWATLEPEDVRVLESSLESLTQSKGQT